jgi:ABC-type transport system involved in cytochrome c biogenesis permease component
VSVPGTVTPIIFFTLVMSGLFVVLGKTIEALRTTGPWLLCIAIPLILLLSVVRLVRSHPDGLMGSTPADRPARRLPKRG